MTFRKRGVRALVLGLLIVGTVALAPAASAGCRNGYVSVRSNYGSYYSEPGYYYGNDGYSAHHYRGQHDEYWRHHHYHGGGNYDREHGYWYHGQGRDDRRHR